MHALPVEETATHTLVFSATGGAAQTHQHRAVTHDQP